MGATFEYWNATIDQQVIPVNYLKQNKERKCSEIITERPYDSGMPPLNKCMHTLVVAASWILSWEYASYCHFSCIITGELMPLDCFLHAVKEYPQKVSVTSDIKLVANQSNTILSVLLFNAVSSIWRCKLQQINFCNYM